MAYRHLRYVSIGNILKLADFVLIVIRIAAGLILLLSLVPLIRHDFWTFRVFEFPRAQKWVINALILAVYLSFVPFSTTIDWVVFSLLIVNSVYLTYQIFPYLPIAPRQIKSASKHQPPHISLLISNVYQYNRKFRKLESLIKKQKADIVLLLETDKWWREQCVESFGAEYPHQVLEDMENTYGMLLFSRLPLKDTEVKHLIKEDVPSIETIVELPNKKWIKLFGLHPEPPVPGENCYSTERDAEILLTGKQAAQEKLPVIVAGDLNDVAWSYSTSLFQKISGLLDPRRGRGFFSTFHAKYVLARWPLDHIFCSAHFRLNSIKRLPHIGSDHFPILVKLHLAAYEDNEGKMEADREDKEAAREKIANGREQSKPE